MDFLFITTEELSALMGLPYVQQSAYLLGIRPYMDRKTFLVGIKRRISYQSLAEVLYIEPHPGIKSGSPSRQQLRRVVKGLERAGLIEIQSFDKHLVLKCLLANTDFSVLNKADTKQTQVQDTKPYSETQSKSDTYQETQQKDNTQQNPKADIPHNSEKDLLFLNKKFEQFWFNYPNKKSRNKAREEFIRINPDQIFFNKIFNALIAQIEHNKQLQLAGEWLPPWKYPANWLAQQCWEDELTTTVKKKEKQNAEHARNNRKQGRFSIYQEIADDDGLDFDEEAIGDSNGKVVPFQNSRD